MLSRAKKPECRTTFSELWVVALRIFLTEIPGPLNLKAFFLPLAILLRQLKAQKTPGNGALVGPLHLVFHALGQLLDLFRLAYDIKRKHVFVRFIDISLQFY